MEIRFFCFLFLIDKEKDRKSDLLIEEKLKPVIMTYWKTKSDFFFD